MQYKAVVLSLSALTALVDAGVKTSVGSVASMLQRLEFENTAVSRVYAFPTHSMGEIQVGVEDYSFASGYLSMVGRAKESQNSDFILKGGAADLYGWVVLKDRNLAFEYTTDNAGNVMVEEVPVTKIFPVCDFPDLPADAFEGAAQLQKAGPEPHIGPYPADLAVNKFQSKPGATKILYWDITAAPNLWPPAQMWEAWQGLSAGLSMYDVNVTTDPAIYAATAPANRGSARQGPADGRSSCGLNAFGTSSACTIYKKSSATYQGGTLWHELGHLLGLSHDGSSSAEYASGFTAIQWCPIMGNFPVGLRWNQALWQYSKGEYSGANQKQDDFTGIGRYLQFREDDIPGTKPLTLTEGTKVSAALNRGQIGKNTDTDLFSFQVTGAAARAKLKIDPTEARFGSNLDIKATIQDATGKEMANNNKPVHRGAELDVALPAGNYTLTIEGGAEGTPDNGFSKYSSLGFYAIEGEITGGVVGVASATDPGRNVVVTPMAGGTKLKLAFPAGARVGGITLFSTGGKALWHSMEKVEVLDLSGLAPGTYLLRVAMKGGSVVRNVVRM